MIRIEQDSDPSSEGVDFDAWEEGCPAGADELERAPLVSTMIRAAVNPLTARSSRRLVRAIFRDFFAPQYIRRGAEGIKPFVNVEHPLDRQIPFNHRLGYVYHRFFFNYFRAAGLLLSRCGRRALPEVNDLIEMAVRLYEDAGWVYRRVQATTPRPPLVFNGAMIAIHLFDPHRHCVPSLHVASVYATWAWLRRAAPRLMEPAAAAELAAQAFYEATIITESVLFVKQHSLNCVAATFLMLGEIDPWFDEAVVGRCLDALFSHNGADLAVRGELRAFMRSRYCEIKSEFQRSGGTDWRPFLVDWVKSFPEVGNAPASHG